MATTRVVRVAADDWSKPDYRAHVLRTAREDAVASECTIEIKCKLDGRLQVVATIQYVAGRHGFNTSWRFI